MVIQSDTDDFLPDKAQLFSECLKYCHPVTAAVPVLTRISQTQRLRLDMHAFGVTFSHCH
ncbi:MAG: hypothetical protein A3H24_07615 [Rhodoferax sp. RIFCSPLOWO2_12_FULL_60_11]|nr:MAG: hypothetical protein A3H24_07615 [Rhodoferax sp. RIFCSPLOWO2_12_FULL_60_11]